MDIHVYTEGICHLSCCADSDDPKAVERELRRMHPSGIESQWTFKNEPFRTGEPNPTPCETTPGRYHFLFSC